MSIPYDNQTTPLPVETDQPSTRESQQPPTKANRKPFRLWPGVAAAVLLLLGRYIVPSFIPEAILYGLLAAMLGILAIVVWWVFFSRAPWIERLGAIALMVVGVIAT